MFLNTCRLLPGLCQASVFGVDAVARSRRPWLLRGAGDGTRVSPRVSCPRTAGTDGPRAAVPPPQQNPAAWEGAPSPAPLRTPRTLHWDPHPVRAPRSAPRPAEGARAGRRGRIWPWRAGTPWRSCCRGSWAGGGQSWTQSCQRGDQDQHRGTLCPDQHQPRGRGPGQLWGAAAPASHRGKATGAVFLGQHHRLQRQSCLLAQARVCTCKHTRVHGAARAPH